VPLADLGRLDAAVPHTAAALAQRLADVGFHRGYVQALTAQLPGLPAHLQTSGLAWLTLDDEQPAALALRLLVLNHSLTSAQLDLLFGDELAARLQAAGLLLPHKAGWRFPLHLELVNQLMVVSDPQGDEPATVMAVGGSTQLLAAACYPQADIGRALDLGCGSGTLALLLAAACQEVVATDINPRALQLARFNAALNGVHNIQWRQGHLFEPVVDERFDLITAQPPFLPQPPGAPRVMYLHGGARGDELTLELLAQAPQHLSADGLAVVLSEFPLMPEPLAARLRAVIPDAGLMLLHAEHPVAAATQVTLYGCASTGDAARESLALHRHLQALGVSHIVQAVVVVHPAGGLLTVTVENDLWGGLHRKDIDRLWSERSSLEQQEHAGPAAQG
jgi:SAM-dependent methyltransferase